MMQSEFTERTGFEPTSEEYRQIEAEYIQADIDKDEFCKQWKKNGGIQRLTRLRAAKIEELEWKIYKMEKSFEAEREQQEEKYINLRNELQTQYRHEIERRKRAEEQETEMEEKLFEARKDLKEAQRKIEIIKEAFQILKGCED